MRIWDLRESAAEEPSVHDFRGYVKTNDLKGSRICSRSSGFTGLRRGKNARNQLRPGWFRLISMVLPYTTTGIRSS